MLYFDSLWDIRTVVSVATNFLLASGVENARLEAGWLLCEVTRMDHTGLYAQCNKQLTEIEMIINVIQ